MALEGIKLWAMDGAGDTTSLETADQTKSERLLEDTLVKNPEMLMPGLTLVGRQTPTDGGPLDLLGIDEDGRVVVFELKRGTLTRDAVAQVIDYASSLQDLPDDDLAKFVSDRSGAHGTTEIEDFDVWYDTKSGGQGFSALKPVRMVLVGLGVDERTTRMVRFLAAGGMDFSLLTFHGFNYNGSTFLARQVQVEAAGELQETTRSRGRLGRRKRRELLDNHVQEHAKQWEDAQDLWNSVLEMFRENFQSLLEIPGAGASNWSKHQLRLRSQSARGTVATMQLGPLRNHDWLVNVIFSQRSVGSCIEEFRKLRRELPFQTWPSNSRDKAEGVLEIGFPLKSLAEWESRKERLASVTRSVYEAYSVSEDEAAEDDD
jgi:hypothetical protein